MTIVFINIFYSSILVFKRYFTKQPELVGISMIIPEIQSKVIYYLDSLEKEKIIRYNYFYLKETKAKNNVLNIKAKCNKTDKYIFLYKFINFLKENGIGQYKGFEYSSNIQVNFFKDKKKVIDLDLKKN